MKLLVDGDIVAYRAAASCEKREGGVVVEREEQHIAFWRVGATINLLKERWKTDDLEIYISGDNNFRYQVDPEYKANRKDMVRPLYLVDCQELLIQKYGSKVTDGYEADDSLGIRSTACSGSEEAIVCSIDKDLLQIPGRHYNWVSDVDTSISEWQGWYNFFVQVLMGDRTDNVIGLHRVGIKTAEKILEGYDTPLEMFEECRHRYNDDERMFRNAKLLWVMREEGVIWHPSLITNYQEPEQVARSSSSPETEEETALSWVPTMKP